MKLRLCLFDVAKIRPSSCASKCLGPPHRPPPRPSSVSFGNRQATMRGLFPPMKIADKRWLKIRALLSGLPLARKYAKNEPSRQPPVCERVVGKDKLFLTKLDLRGLPLGIYRAPCRHFSRRHQAPTGWALGMERRANGRQWHGARAARAKRAALSWLEFAIFASASNVSEGLFFGLFFLHLERPARVVRDECRASLAWKLHFTVFLTNLKRLMFFWS